MMKIEGSGSGLISQRHRSADPYRHQNVMDPQLCNKLSITMQIRTGRSLLTCLDKSSPIVMGYVEG
jgi:hypothetical protein